MNTPPKVISSLLFTAALFIITGCGSRPVPTEDEAKNVIESHVITMVNALPEFIFSPVKAANINSFKLLEVYDHNYDFNQLTEKMQSKVDLNYLNSTKDMFNGDWAIVKISYKLSYVSKSGSGGAQQSDDGTRSQWFLLQKPEDGSWNVGMVLTEPVRE